MITLITLVHIFVCFFLIIVVLLQSGKSGDIAAAFGGQGSQTAFGPRGAATVLTKATTWCAIIFMLTSITLSIAASRKTGKSVFQNYPTAPAKSGTTPAPTAPAPNKSNIRGERGSKPIVKSFFHDPRNPSCWTFAVQLLNPWR